MSDTKFCVNCTKYEPAVWLGVYYPERCTHSEEISPVSGQPMMKFPDQRVGPIKILEIRKDHCKGDWFEERPPVPLVGEGNPDLLGPCFEPDPMRLVGQIEPTKPWWRFW